MANEETVAAASSPAEMADPFNGEAPSVAEFSRYRETGELPERFKPVANAESTPDDEPEKTAEPEGDEPEPESAPDAEEDAQEPPQNISAKARRRFEKLSAEVKELQRKLEEASKKDGKPDSSTAQVQQVAHPSAHAKPTVEDKNTDGTPRFGTYEDYVEALGRWAAKEERAAMEREYADRAAQNALKSKLDDARSRYDDADDVIFPAAHTIQEARIPEAVKQVFSDSDLFVDLCYVVGSDPKELKSFVALAEKNPRAAIGKVFEYERAIKEELAKGTSGSGKAPEKQSTQAPKPPSPVGGGSSRAFDVNDDSLSADEWFKKRNAQLAKK